MMAEDSTVGSIESLFSFNSVLIVGASDDPNRIGGAPIALLKKYGFEGAIYGLHPRHKEVQGVLCFQEPAEVPGQVDVAIYCIGSEKIKDVLPKLADKGIKGLVIFSSGFAEAGPEGQRLQAWLEDFVQAHGIAVLGPNCVGLVSFARRRALSFANAPSLLPKMEPGKVAILSQSSGVATNIWADGVLSGVRFSHLLGTGNEAGLEYSDYLCFLAEDEDTEIVLGYIEALKDGAKFCAAAAEMQRRRKPLVLLRAGRSALGQEAISSHTGRLSSADAAYQAAFDRYGVIRANSLQDLNDHARAFSLAASEPKVVAATTSGGAGVYIADLCDEVGIEMVKLSPQTELKLQRILPNFGRLRNPVDLTAQVVNDITILTSSVQVLLNDKATGILLFVISGKGTPEQSEEVIRTFQALQQTSKKPIVICWLAVPDHVRARAAEAGLMVYSDPARFLRPLGAHFKLRQAPESQVAARSSDHKAPSTTKPLSAATDLSNAIVIRDGRGILSERVSVEILRSAGVDCSLQTYARSAQELRQKAKETRSTRFVMKISEPVIVHKSDVGGVVANLTSEQELAAAWDDMVTKLGAKEVLLSEQIEAGVEIIVGCSVDQTFGLRLTVGSGGIWANFLNDAVTLIPPFDEAYILSSLQRLSVWAALSGARGQRPYAVDRLVQTIIGIADVAKALQPTITEFECNPVIVTENRAVVVDAVGFA